MGSGKILFIVAHRPGRSPGQRFRFEQYLGFLSENGFSFDFSYIINEEDDRIFYQPGKYFRKFLILIKSIWLRINDLRRIKNYDIVFIYREAMMLGSTWFERQYRKQGARIIFDFDDAIWLMDVSQGNNNLRWLKKPSKTDILLKLSDVVFAGNEFLATYSRRFNANVKVVPTTINTSHYLLRNSKKNDGVIRVGWTGSLTTLKHLELAIPVFINLKKRFGDAVIFTVIADVGFEFDGLDFECIRWNKETEISDLSGIDIGIMPLPDNDWARGKCGFKGLQYMALGIPAVMSPVGVNLEIIQDGINGFLAETLTDWTEKISRLIESGELRQTLGTAGRKTVEDRYSFDSQKHAYLSYFEELMNQR